MLCIVYKYMHIELGHTLKCYADDQIHTLISRPLISTLLVHQVFDKYQTMVERVWDCVSVCMQIAYIFDLMLEKYLTLNSLHAYFIRIDFIVHISVAFIRKLTSLHSHSPHIWICEV